MNIDYTIDLDGFGFIRSVTNYTSLRDHRLTHRDKLSLKVRFTRAGVAQDVGTLNNTETHFTLKKLNEENEVLSDDSTVTTWTKTTSGTDVYYTHDGVVDLDTVEIDTLLGQAASIQVDAQFTWKVGSTVYRSRLLKTAIDRALYPSTLPATLATDPARSYVTMLQNVNKLDGDGSGTVALESISTVGLQVPRWYSFVRADDNELYYYELRSGTDAESGITIRRPDDYNATTNPKVFVKKITAFSGSIVWGTINGTLSDQTDLQTALNTKEGTQVFASQAEMEAGTETAIRSMSPLRIHQAIDALAVGGTATWGGITGTLSAQTDLQSALNARQPLDSDLTSWSAITRASGFDAFTATPTLANLSALVSDANIARTDAAQTLAGVQTLSDTTASTNSSTGALIVAGGIGSAKNSHFNGVTVGRGFSGAAGNTGVGFSTLGNTLTGEKNTAIGQGSLASLSGASEGNSALGHFSGAYLTTGNNNVVIGDYAATLDPFDNIISSISNSVMIGQNVRPSADSNTNTIVIGSSAIGLGSNTTVIGNSSTTAARIFGQLTMGTSATPFTFPASDGTSGQALTTNGSGSLSFATISTGITIGVTTANGTAGRVLYTDGTNVQQYAVTGTGDVVRATSPTLVTPILGTPTSGTLTNCTGLPAAGVVGTAAILGANTFTAAQSVTLSGLGTTTTSGLSLINSTAAAAGAQQVSPALNLRGNGWKTTAPAASQACDFSLFVLPIQGTTGPTNQLVFGSSINGATLVSPFVIQVDAVSPPNQAVGIWASSGGIRGFFACGSNSVFGGSASVGNPDGSSALTANGVFTRGDIGQIGFSSGTNPTGTIDSFFVRGGSAATIQLGANHATTATNQTIKAHNVTTGTGADLILSGGTGSVANGMVRFGTRSAIGAETITGFITIKDAGGTERKLAVVS